ncbi:MAG: tRNA pseudouridine(55) synthase TruB [Actinobacteria bacterium HGW-Actinobacteria-7]|nr:MAG: tRNA pseudouridine(55) synthase TruB [Actinobacteria bacterium HGW-Actinobacteria-7]
MSSLKRGQSGLSGVLLVDKPTGMTSHDVVNIVRRATGEKRVGHAGTLDPLASGLLVVLVGPATRLEPYLSSKSKGYEASIRFGSQTDTDDSEGAVLAQAPVPTDVLSTTRAHDVLEGLLGKSMQMPPQYSAIKVGGKIAHRVARSGGVTELAPRAIDVMSAELLGVDVADQTWRVRFIVSKGTYVRALARDIGLAVGSLAHLSALRRVSSGALSVTQSHSLERIEQAGAQGSIGSLFIDPVAALDVRVIEVASDAVSDGRPLNLATAETSSADELVAISSVGRLDALYRSRGQRLVPEVVFATPVARAL